MAAKHLPFREYIRAITRAASMSFRLAPGAVLFKLAGAVLDAILPLITVYLAAQTTTELARAYAGDNSAGNQALVYVALTIGVGLISVVWNNFNNYIQAILRYRIESRVSDMMYERFLALDFWRYEDKDTADTYDKAKRFSNFYAYVFDQLASIFSGIVGMISAIIALFIVVPWIALVVLVALIPGIYIQFKLSRAQIDLWNKNVTARRAQSSIEWNLLEPKYIAELRLNGVVRYLLDLRNKFRNQDEQKRLKFEKDYLGKQIIGSLLESLAELISLVWIVLEIMKHAQPLGQFVYVQQIVSRAIGSTNSLVRTISNIDEDLAQLFEYQKFMSYPLGNDSHCVLEQAPNSIIFDHVSFHYHGSKKEVLHDISMSIEQGQHIAIVGENGAGKSTIVKLLLGLYRPTKGHVLIDGETLSSFAISSWHRYLGVLQQSFLEYDFGTIRDNIYFGDVSKPFDEVRYQDAIVSAEAKSFIGDLKHGDQTYPSKWIVEDDIEDDERATSLSGGQWQRVALARSFYRDAPIIVLDEPTSAIDALAESRIFKRLFEEKQRTIVTISHRLSTVKKADVIYVIEDGRIVESGSHAELVRQRGAYSRLFASQL